jgi:hypothetical protein
MAHAIETGPPPNAAALVDEMQQWRGLVWGPQEPVIVLEDISLQSPPDAWPAVIRLDYRIGDKSGRWEEEWGEELEVGSVEAAAGLWLAIVHIHLMDLREPLPEHMRAAS